MIIQAHKNRTTFSSFLSTFWSRAGPKLAVDAYSTTKRIAAHVPNDHAIGSEFVRVIVATKGEDGKPDGVIIFTENVSEKEAEKSEQATS